MMSSLLLIAEKSMPSHFESLDEPRKIRARIKRYERSLLNEKTRSGSIGDGAGKRYLLGPLYLLMDDVAGAVESFTWFEREFSDDGGEPGHRMCWALALWRSGETRAAELKLRQAMILNLYLLPRLLALPMDRLEMRHMSSDAEPWYVDELPSEYFTLWTRDELDWARTCYSGEEFSEIRSRYVELHLELAETSLMSKRKKLVRELFDLMGEEPSATNDLNATGDDDGKSE